jgi:hypothetical protein
MPEEGQPLAKEAVVLDTVMKTSIIMMQTATIRAGLVISTSKTLVDKWQGLVKSYDNFLNNLKPSWGSNFIKVGGFVAVAGFFIFHMGLARKIPEFALDLISSISIPTPTNSQITDIFMQHPFACVGIGVGVGDSR